ncbi:hypothetical protein [Lysobacter sp. CA196]|uniref:hypothetical protein n=1 Tax=Lysobacter sp. CA196 TaxID=3455606 RepID=UPI003F8CF683
MPTASLFFTGVLGAAVRHRALIVLALLLGSVALNVWQWKRAVTAPLRTENRALGAALVAVNDMATQATRDSAALLAEMDALVERGRTTRVVYRRAASLTPLPAPCAPGADRIQAVNEGLGPSESTKRE